MKDLYGFIQPKKQLIGRISNAVITKNPPLQEKNIIPSTELQNIVPDSGFYGLSKVEVEPIDIQLQDKNVTPTGSDITVLPDGGYVGLSSVEIEGDLNLVSNNIKENISIYGVQGTLHEKVLTDLEITSSKTLQEIDPPTNYDGFDHVTINPYIINNQNKTITPNGSEIIIEKDSSYDGLNSVTVNGDNNLISKNIKKGVSIYNQVGTYDNSGWQPSNTWPEMPPMPDHQEIYFMVRVDESAWWINCAITLIGTAQIYVDLDDGLGYNLYPTTTTTWNLGKGFNGYKIVKIKPIEGSTFRNIRLDTSSSPDDIKTIKTNPVVWIRGNIGNNVRQMGMANASGTYAPMIILESIELKGDVDWIYGAFTYNLKLINFSWEGIIGKDIAVANNDLFSSCSALKYVNVNGTLNVNGVATNMFANTLGLENLPWQNMIYTSSSGSNMFSVNSGLKQVGSINGFRFRPIVNGGNLSASISKMYLDMSAYTLSTYTATTRPVVLETLRMSNIPNVLTTITATGTSMGRTALIDLISDLPDRTGFSTGTLAISGSIGYPDLTTTDKQVATIKNWNIT